MASCMVVSPEGAASACRSGLLYLAAQVEIGCNAMWPSSTSAANPKLAIQDQEEPEALSALETSSCSHGSPGF